MGNEGAGVLDVRAPQLDARAAIGHAREAFGPSVDAHPLESERDRNAGRLLASFERALRG